MTRACVGSIRVPEALFGYWASKRRPGRLPSRADIDPLDMRQLLPHVILLEVVTEAATARRRYRFRLVGTDVARLYDTSLTGRLIDEVLPPASLARYRWIADRVVERRAAIRNVGRVQAPRHEWMLSEVAAMPLAAADAINIEFAGAVAWPENDPPDVVRQRWRAAVTRP